MNLFTSQELYVLASLLGKEFLIGVEGATLEANRSNLRKLFEDNCSELQSRGIIEYKIDGTLLIDHEVREAVEMLNDADTVFIVASERNGERNIVNYIGHEGDFCSLSYDGSRYQLTMEGQISQDVIYSRYGIRLQNSYEKIISIGLEELQKLDKMYDSFSTSEADDYLARIIADADSARLIRECLMRKSDYFILKEFHRIGSRLVNNTEELKLLRYVGEFVLDYAIDGINIVNINVSKERR